MARLPDKAKVVIIGIGGIVGASVARHLVDRGWDDIVGIDTSGVPTDIGSTAHASDFCYTTSHDLLSTWTTLYSIDFYERRGRYARVGGLEVARVGDEARMEEIRRKVASGKAFGTRARLIEPAEIKQKFPLIEEDKVQGGLWDPDAGLVVPRSQTVAGELVDEAEAAGKLKTFANTPATALVIEDGRIRGVVTPRGTIRADAVVVCTGLWGRSIAAMAGEDLPVMPIDHPLTFFGPYNEFAGTGKEIGWPLLRDQGNSAYMRDTGDPETSEGGMIEWGYYEETHPRLCHPRDLVEKHAARLSPSQRDLSMDEISRRSSGRSNSPHPRRTRLRRTPFVQRPLAGDRRRRPQRRREPRCARPLVRRRHLGQGRAGDGETSRRLDDRRAHGDRLGQDRRRPLLPAPARRGFRRGALSIRTSSARPSSRAAAAKRALERAGTPGRILPSAGGYSASQTWIRAMASAHAILAAVPSRRSGVSSHCLQSKRWVALTPCVLPTFMS